MPIRAPRLKAAFTRARLSAFGAGLLVAAGQEPLGLWPVALAGLVLVALFWRRTAGAREAAICGWAAGFGTFLGSMTWLVNPFLVEPWRHGALIPFALFFMAGGLALFWALGFFLAKRLGTGLPGLTAFWGAAELLRGHVFTGFPWAMPGYVWLDTPIAQLSALVGPYGLTALTFGLAALIAAAWQARSLRLAALALVLFAGAGAFGWMRTAAPLPPDRDVVVRVVQPYAPQRLKWDPEHVWTFYERALDLSDPQGADLVIWPETSVAMPLHAAGPELAEIAARTAPARAIVGLNRIDGMRGYNTAVFLDTSGRPVDSYDKHHLVPFGEYMPLPGLMDLLGLRAFTAKEGYGYSPGPGPHLMETGAAGLALPLICYEAIFPRDLRTQTRPDWLLQMTNDAWFGTFSGPQQSLAQSRFRTIETGLPMVRAANTGISGVIDPHGHMRVAIPLGQPGAVNAALPAALPKTVYAALGEGPAIALLILLALTGFASLRIGRGGKSD
ncbi:apolipoprotein N-acyltransferase [Celeribacter indicus]|uniref:Apolipoprotein N-acyltransferase n=1 Tax=Celeribacter indicus TaxID=1208324 RepID=A0A0B5DR89_9RHOB|nr:apolipoprotein N-acyltransferase [Celeribacter indicus]AJE46038.1 apolipoprotein N-acyltransferase [Celeribacter indicus]SDX33409.1 Apolipoprotein N-acyltransferase [Celeribacter indicus]